MIEIIPSTSEHVRELVKTLREKDKAEARALGVEPHRGVFYAFKHACYKKTALVDGKVAAMWGIHGDLLGSIGHPYFITGTEVEKISPVRFARIYRQEVLNMSSLFPVLENYVDASYTGAVRMLEIAGFILSPPVLINNNEFLKFRLES